MRKARGSLDKLFLETLTSDPIKTLFSFDNERRLRIVTDYQDQLLAAGTYEGALLLAYMSCRTNHRHFSIADLALLFRKANRRLLLAAGDRLPSGKSYTVYRGVAGPAESRNIRSFSWTSDYDKAVWFSKRWPKLEDPAVYQATICREEVLAYVNQRKEHEFIVRPRYCRRVQISSRKSL